MTIRLTDERVRWLVEEPDVATTRTTIESLAAEVQERRAIEAKLRELLTDAAFLNAVDRAARTWPTISAVLNRALRLLDGEQ